MTHPRHRGVEPEGFTLLEVLAVLLIGAVLMSLTIPNLSTFKARALHDQAMGIVAKIDLGRQQAVVTGIPHRIFIDLDAGSYGLEWEGGGEPTEPADDPRDPSFGDAPLSLEPPPLTVRQFAPVPGVVGHTERLTDDIEFVGIETEGGWVRSGEAYVQFNRDGTSSPTTIVLDNPDGRELSLQVRPLAESVRIVDEEG